MGEIAIEEKKDKKKVRDGREKGKLKKVKKLFYIRDFYKKRVCETVPGTLVFCLFFFS